MFNLFVLIGHAGAADLAGARYRKRFCTDLWPDVAHTCGARESRTQRTLVRFVRRLAVDMHAKAATADCASLRVQIERECAERVQQLESQLAATRAEVEEAQRDAAAFAQDLADHLSRQGAGGGGSGPSAADRAALKQVFWR